MDKKNIYRILKFIARLLLFLGISWGIIYYTLALREVRHDREYNSRAFNIAMLSILFFHFIIYFENYKKIFIFINKLLRSCLSHIRFYFKKNFNKVLRFGGPALLGTFITLLFTTIMNVSDNYFRNNSTIALAELELKNNSFVFEKEYKLNLLNKFNTDYLDFYKKYFLDKAKYLIIALDSEVSLTEKQINDINIIDEECYLQISNLIKMSKLLYIKRDKPEYERGKDGSTIVRSYRGSDLFGFDSEEYDHVFDLHIKYIKDYNKFLINRDLDENYIVVKNFRGSYNDKEFKINDLIKTIKNQHMEIKSSILSNEIRLLEHGQNNER